jgi:hypothetical protein
MTEVLIAIAVLVLMVVVGHWADVVIDDERF